jgi:hypothetical protein
LLKRSRFLSFYFLATILSNCISLLEEGKDLIASRLYDDTMPCFRDLPFGMGVYSYDTSKRSI